MLLLAPNRMAIALKNGSLPERTQFGVVAVGAVLGMLISHQSILGARTYGELLLGLMYAGIVVAGIRACYRANGGGLGHHFAERYVCLAVPTGVWVYGAYYILYYGAFVVLRARPGFDARAFAVTVRTPFTLLAFVVTLLYYWLLRRYLRSIVDVAAL